MKFQLDITIPAPATPLRHQDSILLVGSCFTQHIGNHLADLKFPVLQNPNGILFDVRSVCASLDSYMDNTPSTSNDLFYLHELWQSWQHHSEFSGQDQEEVLRKINGAREAAHHFLRHADWLIITLGTAFSYRLQPGEEPVANCHRAPGQWFRKHLMEIGDIDACLRGTLDRLAQFNPSLKVIFTISPVRHIRDGVIENNRSKARLIEAVHRHTDPARGRYYFPAYELVIDVLRDHRFYDVDLVHPNYAATEYVFDQFAAHYLDPHEAAFLEEIKKITAAARHRPTHPGTDAHKKFQSTLLARINQLQETHPYLDFTEERRVFHREAEG